MSGESLGIGEYVIGSVQAFGLSLLGLGVDHGIESLRLDDALGTLLQLGVDAFVLGYMIKVLDDYGFAPSSYVALSMFTNVQANLLRRIERLSKGIEQPIQEIIGDRSKGPAPKATMATDNQRTIPHREEYDRWHEYDE